jgi:hypothetical protein
MNAGHPVLFCGYCVDSVETRYFDASIRALSYQLFYPRHLTGIS